jgi:cysteine desulfurase
LRPDTRLISMMLANNETGVLQPVEEIGRIAAGNEAFYHVDAVQAAGKVAVDVARIGCDALSLSGHKFHAPKGVGCLFLRDWEAVGPFIFGGGQEAGLRSGTENLLGIAGIGVAAREALAGLTDWSDQMTALTDRLRAGLDDLVGGIVANGGGGRVPILPNTLNVSVAGVRGEALAALLDARHGIAVSIGSACGNNRAVRASHVLRAMGLSDQRIAEAIRISIGRYTTGTEIDGFVGAMAECVGRLRRVAGTSRHAA